MRLTPTAAIAMAGSLCLGLQLAGCALTTEHVTLRYSPDPNPPRVERASAVVVAVDVVDLRAKRDRISSKKNGYGIEMAPFVADNDVARLIADAVQAELRNRGFTIAAGSSVVRVELQKFYCEAQMGFWSGGAAGEAVMNVQVIRRDGSIVFSKLVDGQGNVTGLQIMSEVDVQKALDLALRDALSKLMQDAAFTTSLVKAAAS